jgi:hypothetical protein
MLHGGRERFPPRRSSPLSCGWWSAANLPTHLATLPPAGGFLVPQMMTIIYDSIYISFWHIFGLKNKRKVFKINMEMFQVVILINGK